MRGILLYLIVTLSLVGSLHAFRPSGTPKGPDVGGINIPVGVGDIRPGDPTR